MTNPPRDLAAIYSVLTAIDTHLRSIAQSLRDQAQETRLLREAITRHLHPRASKILAVSRATYAGEEAETAVPATWGKDTPRVDKEGRVIGTGGVPGFRRR